MAEISQLSAAAPTAWPFSSTAVSPWYSMPSTARAARLPSYRAGSVLAGWPGTPMATTPVSLTVPAKYSFLPPQPTMVSTRVRASSSAIIFFIARPPYRGRFSPSIPHFPAFEKGVRSHLARWEHFSCPAINNSSHGKSQIHLRFYYKSSYSVAFRPLRRYNYLIDRLPVCAHPGEAFLLLLHKARQQPDGGRSPVAAGDESRRCLLCPGAAGAGCAPNPHPAGAL